VAVARLGVPPHVTILSPFLDTARLDAGVFATLALIAAAEPPFEVTFARVQRWPGSEVGPGVVWLEPAPAAPFVALTRAVWAAFPDCPPYGRPDDELMAHLTIAIDDPARFDEAEEAAAPYLPFLRSAAWMCVLVEDDDGSYRTRRRLRLG
jgi:2'-5' RNA ligase